MTEEKETMDDIQIVNFDTSKPKKKKKKGVKTKLGKFYS